VERALKDFKAVQSISPNLAEGYAGAGDCFEALNNPEKAIKNYNKAIEVDISSKAEILFKRARLYYKTQQLNLGINDLIDYINNIRNDDVQALLLLGKMQTKIGNTSEALINLEQIIKYDKEGIAITAVVKMAKIKLKQKDYYGAHYTLQRPIASNVLSPYLKKLNHYLILTEAVFSFNRY
jgi:tetratricopeptide (TPR) repeat protein